MIDGHIHYAESLGADNLNKVIEMCGFNGIGLQCIPTGQGVPVEEDAFRFKEQSKVPVYIFGGIKREIYELPETEMRIALPKEAERLMQMGCCGIKMLEGKPNTRKAHPIPDFDKEVWEDYWILLEERQIPVYMHVNDPAEFWDESKVSEFAKKAGWFYDETYVNNEDQYRQMLNVLVKHPKLKILFPHFFFMSEELERLSAILERYPNVYIDITPGIELYYNLSRQHEEAAQFFEKFQDRICFGTDIGARAVIALEPKELSLEESESRMKLITRFLETKGDYVLKPDGQYVAGDKEVLMHGLGLSEEVLKKIYEKNFLKFTE